MTRRPFGTEGEYRLARLLLVPSNQRLNNRELGDLLGVSKDTIKHYKKAALRLVEKWQLEPLTAQELVVVERALLKEAQGGNVPAAYLDHQGLAAGRRKMWVLEEGDWPAVYQLMREQDFPGVPGSYAEAKSFFASAKMYGWTEAAGAGWQVVLIMGPVDDGLAFLDVVCAPGAHGRWATPSRLRGLYRLAFGAPPQGFGLKGLWVQPHSERALKACVQAGFRPMVRPGIVESDEPPVLMMTAISRPPKYCRTMN